MKIKITDSEGKSEYFSSGVPIGFTYIQFPGTPTPRELWGGDWLKMDYGGCYLEIGGKDLQELPYEFTAAGLPNITGSAYPVDSSRIKSGDISWSGCFSPSYQFDSRGGGDGYYRFCLQFDASKSNSIYGNSKTVTPQNIKVFVWKKIA